MRRFLPSLLLALCIIGLSAAYEPDTLTITFLDVGQADAILVQAPNGQAMLVDAGESGTAQTVASSLADEGITQLAYVVATHDHDDHIGGMVHVLPQVTVGQFVTNGLPASTQTAADLRAYLADHQIASRVVKAGDTIALDVPNVTVTVLNPSADPGTDENEASVVLRLVFDTQSFLLAGDAGTTAEGWMLASSQSVAA